MRTLKLAALALIAALSCSTAQAGLQYGFWNISNNNATNTATGRNQLQVDVSDVGNSQVLFTFTNTGPKAASITDIYFQNAGELSSLSSIQNQTGVIFRAGANPATLPYQANIGFTTATNLNSESTSISYGVNPGESVGLTMNISSGRAYYDVLAAIAASSLRVGVYVRGFSNGGNESFVNNASNLNGVPIVPEPSSLALTGIAGIALLWRRRPRKPVECIS